MNIIRGFIKGVVLPRIKSKVMRHSVNLVWAFELNLF